MPTSVYLAYEGDEEPPPSIVRAARRVAQRLRRGPRPEQIVAGGALEVSPAPRTAPVAAMASLDGLPPRPLGPDEPANHDYVANIRDAIHQLVNIEMKLGSDELAPLALRYLRAARRRLDQRQYELSVEGELQAAHTELAEIAAWLLHDAGRQDAARQAGYEALHLARLAGSPQQLDLFILGNLASRRALARETLNPVFEAASSMATGVTFTIASGRRLARLPADCRLRGRSHRPGTLTEGGPLNGDRSLTGRRNVLGTTRAWWPHL